MGKNGFVMRPSLLETLRQMRPGDSMVVKCRDFKYSSGRTAKYKLLKEGIILNMTEAGMVDEWKVTRVK